MNKTTDCGIAGDWHGNTLWAVMALDQYAIAGITHILHVGDFGFGFGGGDRGEDYLRDIQNALVQNNQIIYVTLGNHENYVMISSFVNHPEMPGFVFNPDFPNILVATRGARWDWNDVSFVSLGGAASIDYEGRTEGINWWSEERISLGDVYRTIEGGHADVMIAHDAPTGVNLFGSHREARSQWSVEGLAYADQSRDMMRQAVDGVKPDMFFHGHYHHYLDEVVNFNDGVEGYSYRNVSLGKDGQANNMSVLDLVSMQVSMLKMPGEV